MADRLSALLERFELHAHVLHAGALCGAADEAPVAGVGHLHLLRGGRLRYAGADGARHELTEPTLLFVPHAIAHRLETDPGDQAELVCLSVDFGAATGNPLLHALPPLLVLPLAELPDMAPTLDLLFAEAFAGRCGHRATVDRLAEVLVVQLLRHTMQQRLLDSGVLAGLADERLARALTAMHAQPGRAWTLERMAEAAGMSRARFAARFTEVVRTSPGDYLAGWRVSVAKTLLRRGRSLKWIAAEVGYGSATALSRAFAQRTGMAPTRWTNEVTAR